MKRHAESVESLLPELPRELLLHIVRQGQWHESGALARTCRWWMRELLCNDANLRDAVQAGLTRGRLFRWLTLSLPCDEEAPTARRVQMPDGAQAIECFITGGAVCQRVHDRQWECDIDVWARDAEHWRLRIALYVHGETDTHLDLVRRDEDPERCLERFDVSVAQQGYYQVSGAWFQTPLARYSARHKQLVALPSNQLVEYTAPSPTLLPSTMRVDVWYYIRKHRELHDAGIAYHRCAQCDEDPSSGHAPFQKWRARMRRYVARFPDFSIIYANEQQQ